MDVATHRPEHFLWDFEDGVGVVTLNRPEKKNPLTFESYAELRDFFRALKSDTVCKVVIITGAGGNFSSGGDVFEIIGPLTEMAPPDLLTFTQMTGDLVKAIRLGTSRTKTGFLFVRVGLAGADMGACAILPRIIGQGRASELLFTGRMMSAEEGDRWGFYNRVVAPDELMGEARRLAEQLRAGPTFAHGVTKAQLSAEWDMGLNEAIDAEATAQAVCMQTKDFRRAYEAFAEKRDPVFEGD
jgi:enoyl-CoA hydratase/carnithine racemase